MGNAISVSSRAVVKNPKGLNRFAIWIGQQWKTDLLCLPELLKDVHRIVADCGYLNVALPEAIEFFLQLNQLLLAEWSPTRRAMEHDCRWSPLEHLRQTNGLAQLVLQFEVWRLLANLKPRQV